MSLEPALSSREKQEPKECVLRFLAGHQYLEKWSICGRLLFKWISGEKTEAKGQDLQLSVLEEQLEQVSLRRECKV